MHTVLSIYELNLLTTLVQPTMKKKFGTIIDAVETWPWCIFTYTIEEKGGDLSKIGYIKVNKDTKCCS